MMLQYHMQAVVPAVEDVHILAQRRVPDVLEQLEPLDDVGRPARPGHGLVGHHRVAI